MPPNNPPAAGGHYLGPLRISCSGQGTLSLDAAPAPPRPTVDPSDGQWVPRDVQDLFDFAAGKTAVPPGPQPEPESLWGQQNVITGFTVPAVMIVVTMVCKFLTIRNRRIRFGDFALGADLSIAALASSLVRLVELFFAYHRAGNLAFCDARDEAHERVFGQFSEQVGFFVVVIVTLLFVLLIHHRWQAPISSRANDAVTLRKRRVIWLMLANLLGLAILGAMILLLRIPCDV